MKKEIEVSDEENSIVIEDEYTIDTYDFFPEEKKIKISSSIKNDCFYNNSVIEYKISEDPIELKMRTIELSHEPPMEYSIKDGVVLESEIKKRRAFRIEDVIKELKKGVEWTKIPIFENYEVNLFILSKHTEIISREVFRKFLRQSIERLKGGITKVKEAIKNDAHNLQIHAGDNGDYIWYVHDKLEKQEMDKYWKLSEKERDNSLYGKKIKYVEELNNSLFDEESSKFVDISEQEFRNGNEIIDYITKLLDKKELTKKKPVKKISKGKSILISLLLTFFLSWIISWFVDINAFLIFIIVNIIIIAQSIIGNWLTRKVIKE